MLIPVYNPRLSSNPFWSPHYIFTTIAPFNHNQCSRLTAHSSSSGHAPPTLSPLFGPILFGLSPAALPFHHTYLEYLRAINAMDHVLLAFVRWQDAPSNKSSGSFGGGPGSAASPGVPTRLKDWIRGYPAMLPEPATQHDRREPRHGARTVRVVSVRRNVRMYTPDLVKTATSWASRPPSGVTHPKCIRTILGLGASGSTDAQADAAIHRQFQEAHGPSPKFPSTYGRRIVQCVDCFLYHGINARRKPD